MILLPLIFKYSSKALNNTSKGYALLIGINLFLNSLLGACKEIAKLICNPLFAYSIILGAIPHVEIVI